MTSSRKSNYNERNKATSQDGIQNMGEIFRRGPVTGPVWLRGFQKV